MFGHVEVVQQRRGSGFTMFSSSAFFLCCCSVLMTIWIPSTSASTTSESMLSEYVTGEFVTEVYTEVISEPTTSTTEETEEEDDESTEPDHPGGNFLAMEFTITNRVMEDRDNGLEMEVVKQVTPMCQRFEYFFSVVLLSFRRGDSGGVTTEVAVQFKRKLDPGEEYAILQTFYEAVEINGTIGQLKVATLYAVIVPGYFGRLLKTLAYPLSNIETGKYRRIEDACDIVECPHDSMNCVSEGVKCFSTCDLNPDYCLNNSTCEESISGSDFIGCSCVDGFKGSKCETPKPPRSRPYSENVFIGLIAAASVVFFCFILLIACLMCSRIRRRKGEYRSDIYPAENVIALEMSNDYFIVGGVGCQTDDSFLLTQYMLNGIPPKPGFSHSVMQTTDSFLLAKHQGKPYVKKGKTAPAPSIPTPTKLNGTATKSERPVDVVVNVSDEKKLITPSEKDKQAEEDLELDNKGAINEGFVKDDDEPEVIKNVALQEADEEMKDPKRIVKV